MRLPRGSQLVVASHNEGKVREIRELLAPYGIEPISAASLDLPEPEETGTTFVANAELKAMQAVDLSGLPALADDSGLCVEALGGVEGAAPGDAGATVGDETGLEARPDLAVEQVVHDAVAELGGPDFAHLGPGDDEADRGPGPVAVGM